MRLFSIYVKNNSDKNSALTIFFSNTILALNTFFWESHWYVLVLKKSVLNSGLSK